VIHFNKVSKRYPNGHQALFDVSFNIDEGEMVFLTGHSGAGKSSILKLIPLIERPTAGQVIVDQRNLAKVSRRQIPALRRDVGVIFQDCKLLNDRNVFDNVALPLMVAGNLDPREVARRVRAALDKVGLLKRENDFPLSLSGGEQQRVGIARAVVNKPKVLIADEPTGNLDPGLSAEIMQLFEQFNQVGVTLLIASHDLELVSRLKKRILVVRNGQLVADEGGAREAKAS